MLGGSHGQADGNESIIVYAWEDQLVRVNTDGSNRQVLADGKVQYICIYDNWIFYTKFASQTDPDAGIFRIRVDGTGNTKICSQATQELYVVDDWVYYLDWDYTTDVYRMRIDGTDKQLLYHGSYDSLFTDGYFLYFADYQNDTYLRAPLDGGAYTVLIPSIAFMPQVADGWVYFVDGSDFKNYRIRLDGTDKEPFEYELIPEDPNGSFIVTTPEVYFNSNLYYANRIIDTETGEYREYLDFFPTYIMIAGNHLVILDIEYDDLTVAPMYRNVTGTSLWLTDLNGDNPILLESNGGQSLYARLKTNDTQIVRRDSSDEL